MATAKPRVLIEHPKSGLRYAVTESTYNATYAAQGFTIDRYEDGTAYVAPKRVAATTDADKPKDKDA